MSETALSAAATGVLLARERRIAATSMDEAFEAILRLTEGELRDGTYETPRRAAAGWAELTDGYAITNPASLLKTFDAEGYDEMIAVSHIDFESLCEHHMLPFIGQAGVVYIPDKLVVGLSKIPRLVDVLAHRLQQQERLTAAIADVIEKAIAPLGVLVYVEAVHMCACHRGVKKPNVSMRTSVTRGYMRDDHKARDEALALVNGR